jgi:hypothetical protein
MKKAYFPILICLIALTFKSRAQQDMTIYPMQIIPQSNYSNPALIPVPKFHISMLPALSSIYIDGGHTGFNAHHFISISPGDSVEVNLQELIDQMGAYNYVNFNTSLELLSFGFKLKEKHYFNFAVSNKMYARFCYPKDLFNFIYKGNGAFFDETLKFSRMGINAAHYNEIMLGYSMIWDDKWTFGAHLKILQGLSNVWMRRADITLMTEEEHFFITATSDIDAYASLPSQVWEEEDSTGESEDFNPGQYFANFKNMGAAIDLGATYKYNDQWTFGASVIDLGFFRWNSDGNRNFKSINSDGSFTFEGIDITEFLQEQDTTGAQSKLDNLLDSIADIFQIDTLYGAYTSPLNTRFYFSGTYQLTPKDQFSGLVRLHLYNRAVHPALTLGYMRKFGNILSLSGTYTMASRKYFNLGFGMAANFGPVQLYLTTDNLISPVVFNKYYWSEDNELQSLTVPRNTKFMNVHLGFNLIFGYKPPKESSPIY